MRSRKHHAFALTISALASVFGLMTLPAPAAESSATPKLTDLSLEDLLKIEVTSVSKRPQRISDTAAAVFVVTSEDIRRSGATSLMDALRMVPGVQVSRIDGQGWAISARGFNTAFANKLLVLVDGRSTYSPLFSGVFWDRQDTFLEDVERIEVIRGPGATIWGANAVNGVINVITKRAADTQGSLVSATFGPTDRRVGARYGTTLGEHTSLRLFANNLERDDMARLDDRSLNGGVWRQNRVGFRSDSALSDRDNLTVSGEAFNGDTGGVTTILPSSNPAGTAAGFNSDGSPQGGHLKSRWSRQLDETSSFALDFYYDISKRAVPGVTLNDSTTTTDLAAQHNFMWGERQKIVWGVGYRDIRTRVDGGYQLTLNPAQSHFSQSNLFAQDEITLIQDRLRLTLGAKFEHTSLTKDTAFQPDARLLWNINDQQALWTSVSRASRLPAVAETSTTTNVQLVPGQGFVPPTLFQVYGGSTPVSPERLTSYQAGYRHLISPTLSMDIVGYYNEYKNVITAGGPLDCSGLGFSSIGPYVICRSAFDNGMSARSHGGEAVLDWRPLDRWRLQATYSYLEIDTSHPEVANPGAQDQADRYAGSSPRHQVTLRSLLDVTDRVQTDIAVRYVDQLNFYSIAAYTALDARIGWQATKNLDLSLIGRNLFDSYHQEFGAEPFFPAAQVRRSVFLRALYSF